LYRYRKSFKKFNKEPRTDVCAFCELETDREIVEQTQHAIVLHNKFPYDLWELIDVTEHLMVIPKRHVKSLSELDDAELLDLMRVIAAYESKNYNVYARSIDSVMRSVPLHQHTHLINTSGKPPKAAFYFKKPHVVRKI
jgi:diadenosine tetraphosphate (Ap4A) HIT family hydrolase